MKSKKTHPAKVHDLRDINSVKVAVPDVSAELAGLAPSSGAAGSKIVTPSVRVQTPGQTTHE